MLAQSYLRPGAAVRLCLCLLLALLVPNVLAFDCIEASEKTMRNDDKLLEAIKGLDEAVSVECLASLMRGNHFNSVNFVIDTLEPAQLDEALAAIKEASSTVHDKYKILLNKIEE